MMGLFEHWPYTNFHELNLDWILHRIKYIIYKMEEMQKQIDSLEPGGVTPASITGLSGSVNSGTMSRIYDVMLSYLKHNNDLVYMHKCSPDYNYETGLQADGNFYGNSPMMYPLPVTYGKCGAAGVTYKDAQDNDREGYAINCTTFAILTMLGIPYENTTYAGNVTDTLEQIGRAGYAFNMWQDVVNFKNADVYYNTQRFYKRMEELGLACHVDKTLRNIKPGNIIWQSKDDTVDGIFHCGIVAAVAPLIVSEGVAAASNYLICDVRNAPYPVTFRWMSAKDVIEDGWCFTAAPDYGICQPQRSEVIYKQATGGTSTEVTGLQIQNGEILTFDFDYTPATIDSYLDIYINGTNARTPNRPIYITRPQHAGDVGKKKHYTFPMPMSCSTGATMDPNVTINSISIICHGESSQNNGALENMKVYRGMPSSMEEAPHIIRPSSAEEYENMLIALVPHTNRNAGYDIPFVMAPTVQISIGGVSWAATQYNGVIHVNNSPTSIRFSVDMYGYSNDLSSKYTGSAWTHTATSN